MVHKPTITAEDIRTELLVHDAPGITGVSGDLVWQMRTVDAHAHWSGRITSPIRIIATTHFRSAHAGGDPDKTIRRLETSPWRVVHGAKMYGERTSIILEFLPRIVEDKPHHTIMLNGSFIHDRKHRLFESVPHHGATWKHTLASINATLARVGRTSAHHYKVKPLSIQAYPDIWFGNFDTFKTQALHYVRKYLQ